MTKCAQTSTPPESFRRPGRAVYPITIALAISLAVNSVAGAFSIVETVCRNVKRWRDGDHIERWVGSGLLVAERQFRKVIGHRQIPPLLSSLANAVPEKPIAKGAAAT